LSVQVFWPILGFQFEFYFALRCVLIFAPLSFLVLSQPLLSTNQFDSAVQTQTFSYLLKALLVGLSTPTIYSQSLFTILSTSL